MNVLDEFIEKIKKMGVPITIEPPVCFTNMNPIFVEYEIGDRLVIKYPILDNQLNHIGAMSGGTIATAFDNTMGFLATFEAKAKLVTIDLNTSYHSSLYKGDELTVKAYIKQKGNTIICIYSEAFNNSGKLVATATSKFMIIKASF